MTFNVPFCENPVVILNPNLLDLFLKSERYCVDGEFFFITSEERYYAMSGDNLPKLMCLPYVKSIEKRDDWTIEEYKAVQSRQVSFFSNSYFVDSSGEILGYIWIMVSCGHCNACLSVKLSSLCQRSSFESELHFSPSLFVTLTYNDRHLPDDGLLCREHLQKFMKRLRSALVRSGWTSNDDVKSLKWIYAGEYGKKGRPHYHCILFGFPVLSDNAVQNQYRRMSIIQFAWRSNFRQSNGLFLSFNRYLNLYPKVYDRPVYYDPDSLGYVNVQEISSSGAVGYALKYAFKTQDEHVWFRYDYIGEVHHRVEEGEITTFPIKSSINLPAPSEDGCFYSVHEGFYGSSINLGVPFVQSKLHELLESQDGTFTYTSIHDGVLHEDVHLSKYYLNKIFPSVSKLIPVEVRRAFYNVRQLGSLLCNNRILSKDVRHRVLDCMLVVDSLFPFLSCEFSCPIEKTYFLKPIEIVEFYSYVESDGLDFLCKTIKIGSDGQISDLAVQVDFFFNEYEYLCSHVFDYELVENELNKRNLFFSKLKERSFDDVLHTSLNFSKNHAVTLSKSIL